MRGPLVAGGAGDRHRDRDPHRRPGDRRPAGVGAAVHRRQHPPRLRQHRGPDPALRRDAGAVGRRPAGDQPADHLLGPRDVPGHRDAGRPRRAGRDDQRLRGRHVRRRVRGRGHLERRTRSTRPTTAARPGSSPRTAPSPSRASPRPSRTPTSTCSRSGASRSRYQTLHDAGFEVYSQTLSIVPDQLEELRAVPRAVRPDRPAGGDRLHRRAGPGQRHHHRRRRAVRRRSGSTTRASPSTRWQTQQRARASSATVPTTRSATWTRSGSRACSTRSATPASTCRRT